MNTMTFKMTALAAAVVMNTALLTAVGFLFAVHA